MYSNFFSYWLEIIRLKYNSSDTDMAIQMMQKEIRQKNTNFVFIVHITDLYPYMPSERFR